MTLWVSASDQMEETFYTQTRMLFSRGGTQSTAIVRANGPDEISLEFGHYQRRRSALSSAAQKELAEVVQACGQNAPSTPPFGGRPASPKVARQPETERELAWRIVYPVKID